MENTPPEPMDYSTHFSLDEHQKSTLGGVLHGLIGVESARTFRVLSEGNANSASSHTNFLSTFVNLMTERNNVLDETVAAVANCAFSVYQDEMQANQNFFSRILAGMNPPVGYFTIC